MTAAAFIYPIISILLAVAAITKLKTTPAGLMIAASAVGSTLAQFAWTIAVQLVPPESIVHIVWVSTSAHLLCGILLAIGLALIPAALRPAATPVSAEKRELKW